jgi:hypothetical protein
MFGRVSIWVTVVFASVGCGPTGAATLRVPLEFATVNRAIDAAVFGDSVLVAPGVYTDSEVRVVVFFGPISFRSCAFLKQGVAVVSEGGSGVTTLDMAGLGVETGAAVALATQQVAGQMLLEGFTLKGAALGGQGIQAFQGGALTVRDCVFEDFDGSDRGATGGLHAQRNPVNVYDCVFKRCFGSSAGGMIAHECDALVEGCEFEECDIGLKVFSITGSYGLTVRESRFQRNTKVGLVKGQQVHTAVIEDCWFEENRGDDGLNALIITGPPATIQRCVFLNNTSIGDPGAIDRATTVL